MLLVIHLKNVLTSLKKSSKKTNARYYQIYGDKKDVVWLKMSKLGNSHRRNYLE